MKYNVQGLREDVQSMTSSINDSPMEFGLKKRLMFGAFPLIAITSIMPLFVIMMEGSRKGMGGVSRRILLIYFCLLTPAWLIGGVFGKIYKKYRLKIYKDRISLTRLGFAEILRIEEIERFEVTIQSKYRPAVVRFIPKSGLDKSTIEVSMYCEGYEAVQTWAMNAGIRGG